MSSQSLSFTLSVGANSAVDCSSLSPENPPCILSDNDLMTLVQKGDQVAFGQVFDRYYVPVRYIARKILRNEEDAADVVQETFFDVYQNARSFVPSKGTLKAWVISLAYHRALKRLKLLRRRDRESGDLEIASQSVEATGTKAEQLIRSLDFRRCLNTVFGVLDERQRRTMLLYFFEGQDLSVIADKLGQSLGNTRHHLYRGMAKLRGELVQKGLLQGYIEFVGDPNEEKVPSKD
jgi:RNA polymerase sigma-70 factor, ECF subfamily